MCLSIQSQPHVIFDMFANRNNPTFMEKRNNLLNSIPHQQTAHTTNNYSAHPDRKQHRSAQDKGPTGLQTAYERLNILSKNRSTSQQHDAPSLSAQKKPNIFEGRVNGNIGSNSNSGNKNQKGDLPTPKMQNSTKKESTFVKQPVFLPKSSAKKIPDFALHPQNNRQIPNNMKLIERTLSESGFRNYNQTQNNNTQNDSLSQNSSRIDFQSGFQELISHFSKAGMKSQRYRELAVNFLQHQMQTLTGQRCSYIYKPDQIELLQHENIQHLMKTKMNEVKVLNQIIQQFQNYLSILSKSGKFSEDAQLITHQIWIYFMQQQHERNQEMLNFCFRFFNFAPNRSRFKTKQDYILQREQFDSYIVQKIEKLNKELIEFDQTKYHPIVQQQQAPTTLQKQNINHNNRQAPSKLNTLQSQIVQWRNELKNLKSYKREHRPQTMILRVSSKIKNPQAASSSVYNPSEIRSYRLNSFNIDNKLQEYNDLQVKYSVFIKWFKSKADKTPYITNEFKEFGIVYFSKETTSEELADLIKSQISKKLKHILRTDAKFQYGRLLITDKHNKFQINVEISQRIINNTQEYEVEVMWLDKFIVSQLSIRNQYGTAQWNQEINLQKIDFTTKPFTINSLTVQCRCQELNKPCLLIFNDLPLNLKKKDRPRSQLFSLFAKFMQKERNCKLLDINFESQMFSVEFMNFDNKQRAVQKVLQGYKFQKVGSQL